MNFELGSDEKLLIDSVRDALSRTDTLGAARSALDGAEPVHLWKDAVRGGWTDMPGLLPAVLVLIECGRRLAPTGLLGHLTVVSLLRPHADDPGVAAMLPSLLDGTRRAAFVPLTSARPAGDGAASPAAAAAGDGRRRAEHVPDAAGADVFIAAGPGGVFDAQASAEAVGGYDLSRPVANVSFTLDQALPGDADFAWNVAQTLHAAESLGASEAALAMAVEYAKQRTAFGRAIGSFQAIKHQLTDALRLNENVRSLLYYAAYAAENEPAEFALAANAARFAADDAVDVTTRRCVSVHGGLGATWEHDAHLYFRRAQLARLLLGGQAAAGERVVSHVIPG